MPDTPITYDTVDPHVWAAAYLAAVEHDPQQMAGNVDALASWFAATIEVGRRAAR